MQPATGEVGVGNEAADTGQRFEELDEDLRVEVLDHRADGRWHRFFVAQGEFELIGVVEVLPPGTGRREGVDDGSHRPIGQQTVHHHVGKGFGRRELRRQALGQLLELCATGKRLDHLFNLLGPSIGRKGDGLAVRPSRPPGQSGDAPRTVESGVADRLHRHFESHNRHVEDLLGRSFWPS